MRLFKRQNARIQRALIMILVVAAVIAQPVRAAGAELNESAVQDAQAAANSKGTFKVIGYYCGEWFDVPVEKLQAEKLTHVMYGFLIPTADGTCKPFQEPEELAALIEKCHQAGTEVFVSVGGYAEKDGTPLYPVFEKIGADEHLRSVFVDSIVAVVEQYGFDGVEIDWEYPKSSTSADYEKTILALSAKLKPMGKGLSTALPGTGSTDGKNVWDALTGVTDRTVECFDFISLMCYDLHSDPNHSPIWYSKTSINYWKKFRNVPSEKLVLGMPLYARPSWQQYRFLVDMDRANAYRDYVKTEPLESTYNGLNTLREKTMIAYREAGGVMLFDVNEDTYDDTSVVSMVNDTLAAMDDLTAAEVSSYIWIVADHKPITYTAKDGLGVPFLDQNNRTLVPVRKLFESIGASVSFKTDESGRVTSVAAERNGTMVALEIGSSRYSVNGQSKTMDTAAVIRNGRTFVPVRPVLEAFGYLVTYSEAGKCVYADTPANTQAAPNTITQ